MRILSGLMVWLLVAAPAAAQEQRGSIERIAKDSSGAVLPGVTVERVAQQRRRSMKARALSIT